MDRVPQSELTDRMSRFRARMGNKAPDWRAALIVGKVNMYWFTGTMQDGMLLIERDRCAVLWVRRSFERAADESLFPDIRPMESYRDAAAAHACLPDTVHLETELVPLAMFARLQKAFPFRQALPVEPHVLALRAVKSAYELERIEQAGAIHRRVLEQTVPGLLREGMSEAELATELYSAMVAQGHHGAARFAMFDTEIGIGQIAFGANSLYPTSFNGPGGSRGLGAAVPFLGSRTRKLTCGDLVFVDVGCGVDGYHTDKTMTYQFGGTVPPEAAAAHSRCLAIQRHCASMLMPGESPSGVYRAVMGSLDQEFLRNFMGYGARRVKFLGHGVGLHIDEPPVLAEGFDEPLRQGMAIALEPKKGVGGYGMVGAENTFLVEPDGGRCVTGDHPGMMLL